MDGSRVTVTETSHPAQRRKYWLRRTLRLSQQEAVASATMTATGDNFFNAFAVYLNASLAQMSWLTAFPQFLGAMMQLLSVWVGALLPRRLLVAGAAGLQAVIVALLSLLATLSAHALDNGVTYLIVLATLYHAMMNLIQPQWRAWMGSIVPQRRRGAFFAGRTRLTMATTMVVFLAGGGLLALSDRLGVAWLGFTLLFCAAATGRFTSSALLRRMHDPDPHSPASEPQKFSHTLRQFKLSLQDQTFRRYSFFVAGMQGVVAISAPFFAVYMLAELQWSYLQYSVNSLASIATQFLTLGFWGRFSDRFGNRIVMIFTSCLIPLLPVLWTLSADYAYLLGVQMLSGFAWSGFSLSTANYLYDIRPHKSNFATYAAVQSGLGATAIFLGAILGGLIASQAATLASWLAVFDEGSALFLVFLSSATLRALIALWFIPKATEPRVRNRPQVLQLVFRIARYNAISGVVLDWLTVTKKEPRDTRGTKS